ncbi:NAD-dependent epimerase/dehydratase family protein [Ktedonobacter racemifer]|uniref:NAD-dependent epimerase/dehydratase n=1 Tax=Ktedonobacter racemifer DSM 44963 TaxID=485913 RepID=D6TJD2_KTERA|nr:NAD-dependent epimerase/dehydratase family protein [Ktedonobacter racemifer]EFH89539.1 NAD-dependent epimerase/dehydratase [Ktedonobacter racemifer DSM 44963]
MKLLLLGGTAFLGRHIVESALARGHEVTIFHRGKTRPGLFPQVEEILGDREHDLHLLAGRKWDAVIDTCGYVPRIVRASAQALAGSVEHYTFVASINVYGDFKEKGIDEQYPLATLEDPGIEEVTGETYGPLKALCEQEVEQAFPGKALLVRPGLIVGPWDASNRFTYWPYRLAQGGEVLAPDHRDMPLQWIDVRDLAEWMVRMSETRQTGAFNAIGPQEPQPLGEVLERCRVALNNEAHFTWVAEDFLEKQEIQPWMQLPLWIPGEDGDVFCTVKNAKAVSTGMTFRSLEETARDTLAWIHSQQPEGTLGKTLSPEREREVLSAWHDHVKARAGE